MTAIERLEKKMAQRDTPAGRRFELRLLVADAFVLCAGALGVALASPALIFPAAVAHLFLSALGSISSLFWLASTVGVTALLMAGLTATSLVFSWMGWPHQQTFLDFTLRGMAITASYAIIVGGICSSLIAGAGFASDLVDQKDANSVQ